MEEKTTRIIMFYLDAAVCVSFPFRCASWTRRVVALAPERYDDDDVSVSLSFVSFVLLVR